MQHSAEFRYIYQEYIQERIPLKLKASCYSIIEVLVSGLEIENQVTISIKINALT